MEGGLDLCRKNQAPQGGGGGCCFLIYEEPEAKGGLLPLGLSLCRRAAPCVCHANRLLGVASIDPSPGRSSAVRRVNSPLTPNLLSGQGRAGQPGPQGVRAGRVCAICNRGGCRIGEPSQREQSSKHIFLGAPVLCNDLLRNLWHLSPGRMIDVRVSGMFGW
jgi:hypothetical protein